MSLMESKRNKNLYIDPVFDTKQCWIWTCDPVQGTAWHWVVDFSYGGCIYSKSYIDSIIYVRAVRFGQSS